MTVKKLYQSIDTDRVTHLAGGLVFLFPREKEQSQ